MSKNITEVMAAVYFNELQRLGENPTRWTDLPVEAQKRMLGAMVEVTRMFDMFGWVMDQKDGKLVMLQAEALKQENNVLPINSPSTKLSNRDAKMMGYSGDACPACGGFKTIRTGTCIQCTECLESGGCG